MIGGGGRSRSSAGKCVICEGATSGKCVKTTPISSGKSVKPAPNWLIFWGLFAPLAAVVVIERLDKPSSNMSILFLFWHYRPSDFMPFWHIGMSENMPKSYVPFLVHCPIYGTLKITRIVFSIGHRAAAEVLLFSGVLAVSLVFIRHDSCSDFRIGRRESSDGVFYIENFPKIFFKIRLTNRRRCYTMVSSEGDKSPAAGEENHDRP